MIQLLTIRVYTHPQPAQPEYTAVCYYPNKAVPAVYWDRDLWPDAAADGIVRNIESNHPNHTFLFARYDE